MPATPPTQEQLDTLQAAIYSGVLRVVYEGPPRREITYQSLDQMRAVLAEGVAAQAAASGKSQSRLAAFTKGV